MSSGFDTNPLQSNEFEALSAFTTKPQSGLETRHTCLSSSSSPIPSNLLSNAIPAARPYQGELCDVMLDGLGHQTQLFSGIGDASRSHGAIATGVDPLLNTSADLSTDGYGFGVGDDGGLGGHSWSETLPKQLIFVDSSVADDDQLLAGLSFQAEIIRLDGSLDGVAQISEVLAQRQDVAGIHIVTHGSEGSLQLGNATLNNEALAEYQAQLQGWAASLTGDADILIYGCDVAGNAEGEAFIDQISQWTGADVAASDDLTGNIAQGGDWELEYRTGAIEALTVSSPEYEGVLASVVLNNGTLTYTSTTTNSIDVHDITITTQSGYLYLTDNATGAAPVSLQAGSGVTQDDSNTVKVALSSITNDIQINGGVGRDRLFINSDINLSGGSIQFSGGEHEDSVTINQSLYTQGGDISLTAENITVAAGQTISTRALSASETDHVVGGSEGNSGNITLTGEKITVGSSGSTAQAALLAHVEDNSSHAAGDVTIAASETEISTALYNIANKSEATITLKNTQVKGGAVNLSSSADYSGSTGSDSTGEAIVDFLDNLAINAGVALADSTATVNIDSTSSVISDSFTASATSMTNASSMTYLTYLVGVLYGRIDSTAKVSIAGSVNTQNDLTISSFTDNSINLHADVAKWDTSNVATNSAAAVAISELYTESTAEVTDTAILTAGGNVNVTADTIDRNRTFAKAGAGKDGTLAVSTAISLESGSTNARVDGNVTAQGDVTVDASQENKAVEGGLPIYEGNTVAAIAGMAPANPIAFEGMLTAATTGLWNKLKSLGQSSAADKVAQKGKGQTQSFQLGAAFAYKNDVNNVTARIGGKHEGNKASDTTAATVKSVTGNVTVDAELSYRPSVTASSTLKNQSDNNTPASSTGAPSTQTSEENGKFAGSAAVAIGNYTNTANAYIGEAATVDAAQALSVHSHTKNDYQLQWGKSLTQPLEDLGNADSLDGAMGHLDTFTSGLLNHMNGNFGANKFAVDSWSQARAESDADFALAGAVTVLSLDHTSNAFIAKDANINQDSTIRNDPAFQTVSVEAENTNEAVHFGGNIALPGIVWSNAENKFKISALPGSGTQGESGVGGTVLVMDYYNTVSATIGEEAKVYGDSLKVDADSTTLNLDIGASGGKTEDLGLSGTVAAIYVNNNTTAQVEDGVTLDVGDRLLPESTASFSLRANDRVDSINLLGGVLTSDSIGIGGSVGFNTVTRNTRAVIGNLKGSDDSTDDTTSITTRGDIDIDAVNTGWMGSLVLAGAIATGGSTKVDDYGNTSGTTTAGIGISGASAVNAVTDVTEAYMQDVNLTLGQAAALAVDANNNSEIWSLSGALSFVKGNSYKSNSSTGLAGAYGRNIVDQSIQAYLEDVVQSNGSEQLSDLNVTASNTGRIATFNAGGAGAVASTTNVAVAGAVTINTVENETKAYLKNSTLPTVGNARVKAIDDADIYADAGAASVTWGSSATRGSTSVSVGVSVSHNEVSNATEAFVEGTTLGATGAVQVKAESTSDIDASAQGIAASFSSSVTAGGLSISGAGSGAKNEIDNTIKAYIADGSTVTSGGTLDVMASDDSEIMADAGGYSLAVASGTSGGYSGSVGVSIADNDIHNQTEAYVDNADLTANGKVTIQAKSTAKIDALGIGGSFAAASSSTQSSLSLSGAGAGIYNNIDNSILAQVKNGATITTQNGAAVNVTAEDDSTIVADAGGVSIAASIGTSHSAAVSVGASVATNLIGKNEGHQVKAIVDNATITSNGDVNVTANSIANIDGLAFAGSAAVGVSATGVGLSLAGAGTGIYNTIGMDIAAAVQNGGKIVAGNDDTVTVKAMDDSTITADAGAAALAIGVSSSGAGAGSVGVAVAQNEISNTIKAYIDRGTVQAQHLALSAESTAYIQTFGLAGAVSVAVGAGGSGSAAGSGTGVTNTLDSTIQAYIQNGSDIDLTGKLTQTATDNSTLDTVAIGGSIAISKSAGGSASVAIGAVTLDNTISNTVQAFIGKTTSDNTDINTGGDLALEATSTLNISRSTAVASSLAIAVAPKGVAFSGAGARVNTTTSNVVEAFIRNTQASSNTAPGGLTVDGNLSLMAKDNPTIDATVGWAVVLRWRVWSVHLWVSLQPRRRLITRFAALLTIPN